MAVSQSTTVCSSSNHDNDDGTALTDRNFISILAGSLGSSSSSATSISWVTNHIGPTDIAQDQTQPAVQPRVDLKKSFFGKAQCSFQYELHPWLEYSVSHDAAFCYACRLFHSNAEVTFTSTGYQDWKHALGIRGVFNLHCTSKIQQEAMLNWAEY